MQPALSLGPDEHARRGTDQAAKVAGQVRLIEVAMPRREPRETTPGSRTLRAGQEFRVDHRNCRYEATGSSQGTNGVLR